MPLSPDLQKAILGLRDAREKITPAQALLTEALKLLENGDDTAAKELILVAFAYINESCPLLLNVEHILVPPKSNNPSTHE